MKITELNYADTKFRFKHPVYIKFTNVIHEDHLPGADGWEAKCEELCTIGHGSTPEKALNDLRINFFFFYKDIVLTPDERLHPTAQEKKEKILKICRLPQFSLWGYLCGLAGFY